TPRPVPHVVRRHRHQQRWHPPRGGAVPTARGQQPTEGVQGLHRPGETQLPGRDLPDQRRLRQHLARQVVRQQVCPYLPPYHLRTFATQNVHLERLLDGPDVQLHVPTAMIQIADLFGAVLRGIQQRGRYHEVAYAAARRGHTHTDFTALHRLRQGRIAGLVQPGRAGGLGPMHDVVARSQTPAPAEVTLAQVVQAATDIDAPLLQQGHQPPRAVVTVSDHNVP